MWRESNVFRRSLLSRVSGGSGWIACRHRVLRGLVSIVDGEYDNIKCSNELPPNERGAKIGGPPHHEKICQFRLARNPFGVLWHQ